MFAHDLENVALGFIASQALFVAEELGVLDILARSRDAHYAELAVSAGAHPSALQRLLTALVCTGLLEHDGDGRYTMVPEQKAFFDRTSAHYRGGILLHLKNVTTRVIAQLDAAMADEAPRLSSVLTAAGENTFQALYGESGAPEAFARAMWSLGYGPSRELVKHLHIDRPSHLVDLGGGSGSFAVAALERWPLLTADIFDLPAMEPVVSAVRAEHGMGARLGFIAGDFFRDTLPQADLYSLGYVLSDWPDEQCVALLRAVHRALVPGGCVVLLERLFEPDRTGPLCTALMDLSMMVETGGKHRSEREYQALLVQAGFHVGPVHRSSSVKHMISGLRL